MLRGSLAIGCLWLVVACGDRELSIPTGPTSNQPVTPVLPLPPPTRNPVPAIQQRIDVGQVVRSRVGATDPVCAAGWPYRCRYYGLTAPAGGWLHVTVGWNPQLPSEYPLDMGVIDEQGREWYATAGQPAERAVSLVATAGMTYVIEVWSFMSPDEEFRLETSMYIE